ncbi:hypothetical protein WJX84_000552 [Apatococcus fuscideae]|uniref:DNA primase n=1 Tax=Apatococcus fuscideae TaxID=2026836 RepID=A0AAW1TFD6_9CHLO
MASAAGLNDPGKMEEEPEERTNSESGAAEEGLAAAGSAPKSTSFSKDELLRIYYGRLFPFDDFAKWLSYGNDSKHPKADAGFFQRREFCFTLEGDIFIRYQSFKDKAELQAAVNSRQPAKIDIGPLYNVPPQRRSAYSGLGSERAFAPVERELVFDIDLTDYDDVRTCGKEGHICSSCWPLMALAIQVLDQGLREDFGFQHVLWVYSGRRGVHAWVCDARARRLTDDQRSAIATYFAIYKGQENGAVKLALTQTMHPSVQRAYTMLEEAWRERILPEQHLLEDEEHWHSILKYIPDEDLREKLCGRWSSGRQMVEGDINTFRWLDLTAEVEKARASAQRSKDFSGAHSLRRACEEIVFAHAYPRLDMEVSKKMNHLLKAPFCIHPKTGKVCVPIDPAAANEFDVDAVPTTSQLVAELDAAPADRPAKGSDWQYTSMAGAMQSFQTCFLEGLLAANKAHMNSQVQSAVSTPTLAW